MRRLGSIRWRLQLWHGLLLAVVLGGFLLTAWRLERATLLERVDQELEERISVLSGALRAGPQEAPSARPEPGADPLLTEPRPAPDEPAGLRDLRLPPRDARLFEGRPEQMFYYVIWGRADSARSEGAPNEVPPPRRIGGPRDSRLRGTLRERYHFAPPVDCILVGRDIRSDLADLRRTMGWLMAAGAVVLLFGIAGGWWVSGRALRPIRDISEAAARIAEGDLSRRIRAREARSELDDLVRVLNETFSRLQSSFARQARFTADASHELRTPVSVILTQTQSALARERAPAEYRESLAACQRAAQRVRRLIDSLLLLARLDSGPAAARRPCALDQIAAEAADLVRPLAAERGVDLEIETEPAPCRGGADELVQVASNLLSNAVEYNRPGGKVLVRVRREAEAAVLEVIDNGIGIDPAEMPHVFERFFRADRARQAEGGHVGLGLAISKGIVEAHGGAILAASRPGMGSTFTVRIPR